MNNIEISQAGGSEATGITQPLVTPLPQRTVTSPAPDIPKIMSMNANKTMVLTSKPNNEAELQLYRVMQRASLLAYYDTLLEMGGDDVQQLCDAGEEEFLEIMALVGMASKPLHVRRLQKALQEWVSNPSLFQTPLIPTSPTNSNNFSGTTTNARPPTTVVMSPVVTVPSIVPINSPVGVKEVPPARSPGHNQVIYFDSNSQRESSSRGPSPGPCLGRQSPGSPLQLNSVLVTSEMISALAQEAEAFIKKLKDEIMRIKELIDKKVEELKDKKLTDEKMKELKQSIEEDLKHLKMKEDVFMLKLHKVEKENRADVERAINMAEDDPRRMDEIRKYAAIYDRLGSRKSQKPLTRHEAVVNEAAAQLCRFAPALLTRRNFLFEAAREMLKISGFQCLKGQTSLPPMHRNDSFQISGRNGDENHRTKRPKVESSSTFCDISEMDRIDRIKRQERIEQISEELRVLNERSEELVQSVQSAQSIRQTTSLQQQIETVQHKRAQLLSERSDLKKQPLPTRSCRRNSTRMSISNYNDSERIDTDDTDSQFSLSNASSPSQEVGDSRDSLLRDGENFSNNSNSPFSVKSPGKNSKQFVTDVSSDEGVRNQNENDYDNFYQDNKVQVISSSGGNIIAVANPALSMSYKKTIQKKEEDEDLMEMRDETPLSLKIERQSPRLINHKPD